MEYDEMEKLSLEESKRQTKERKNNGLNMIRPFTFNEKKLLWDGLKENKTYNQEKTMNKFIYKILGCITGNVFTPTPKRARSKGKYRSDNKSTKNFNEAWVGGKAPKKKKKLNRK